MDNGTGIKGHGQWIMEKDPSINSEEGVESELISFSDSQAKGGLAVDEERSVRGVAGGVVSSSPSEGEDDIDFQIGVPVVYIDEGTWDCKVCSFRSTKEAQLMEHLQRSYPCATRDTSCRGCGKYFKGQRGLKVHMGKSNHCKEVVPELTEKQNIIITESALTSQDKTHSGQSRQQVESDRQFLVNVQEKRPIKWPATKDKKKVVRTG